LKVSRLFQINLRIQVYDENAQEHYYATVQDVGKNSFYINQPMSRASQTLFMGLHSIWEFSLIREDALYHFVSRVVGQKTDQVLLIEVEFPEQVYRQQRRNFFRFPDSRELEYWVIGTREIKNYMNEGTVHQLLNTWCNPLTPGNLQEKKELQDSGELPRSHQAYTVDLSGGGLQFVSTQEVKLNDRIFLILTLSQDVRLMIRGEVARVERYMEGSRLNYRVGLGFVEMPDSIREHIIKYIFLQMRQRVT